jgi:hypothetical protein
MDFEIFIEKKQTMAGSPKAKWAGPLSQEDVVIVRVNSSRRSEVKPFLRHSLHLIARRDTRMTPFSPPAYTPRFLALAFLFLSPPSSAFCFRHEYEKPCSLLFSLVNCTPRSFAHNCGSSSSSLI